MFKELTSRKGDSEGIGIGIGIGGDETVTGRKERETHSHSTLIVTQHDAMHGANTLSNSMSEPGEGVYDVSQDSK